MPGPFCHKDGSIAHLSRTCTKRFGRGQCPRTLNYINDIVVWGNTAHEVYHKHKGIIGILLSARFALKRDKVKRPVQEIVSWCQVARWVLLHSY